MQKQFRNTAFWIKDTGAIQDYKQNETKEERNSNEISHFIWKETET